MRREREGEIMAANASTTSSAATHPLPWMAKLLASLLSLLTHVVKGGYSTMLPLGFRLRPWKTKLFASVSSFLDADAAKGSPAAFPCSPPLTWKTRLLVAAVSLITDAVRRRDGTVRRFLSRLDITVGPNAEPVRGVRTADVAVDAERGLWFRLFMPTTSHADTDGDERLPVIVFFHGGGFAFLSPATQLYDDVCRRICRKVRAAVVSVNYRLSPEHRCPAPFDDGLDVLRFLDSRGCGRQDGSPGGKLLQRFFDVANLTECFIAGDSAGANIAHHVARRWIAGVPLPRGGVRLAGLIAIQPFFGGEERMESEVRLAGAPLVNTERTDWLWKAFLPEGADRDHEVANPAAACVGLGEEFPPAMVVVGGFDPLQDWQRRYYDNLRKKGKEASLVEYPDAIHGFYVLPELKAAAAVLIEEMRGFVQKHSDGAAVGKDVG